MYTGRLDSIKIQILPDSLPIPFVLESLPSPEAEEKAEGPSEKQRLWRAAAESNIAVAAVPFQFGGMYL